MNSEQCYLNGRLCFKARPSAIPFILKLVLCVRKFCIIYMWITGRKKLHKFTVWVNMRQICLTKFELHLPISKCDAISLIYCWVNVSKSIAYAIFGYYLRWVYKMNRKINLHRFYCMFAPVASITYLQQICPLSKLCEANMFHYICYTFAQTENLSSHTAQGSKAVTVV